MPRLLVLLLLAFGPLLANAGQVETGPQVDKPGDVIRVYNWAEYIAPQVLADFEKETGIHVDYHTYDSAEELKKVLASGEAIDIAVPTHNDLSALIEAGRLQPLEMAKLPNRQHLDKQLLSKLAAIDPQNRYAIPYLWGTVGLAVNTQLAEPAFGGPLPDSWSLLFDPAQSSRLASCGIGVLDAPDEVLSVLLNYQGHSLAQSPPSRIKRAGEVLDALRPHLKYVDSSHYLDDLQQGQLCVAVAWAGDALAAADTGQPVRFIVPKEGSVLFIDSLVIPSSAQRADLAHRFIDYLMQPKVAALTTAQTLYPSGNADAKQFLEPALREQPSLYPDRATKRRLFALEALSEKQSLTRDQVWARFRDGG